MRLDQGTLEYLKSLGPRTYADASGTPAGYLKPEELSRLLIPQGTLSDTERDEINSHVSHTWKFLSQIPWTSDLRQVPHIAFAHHEKLDGSGYPRKLAGRRHSPSFPNHEHLRHLRCPGRFGSSL